MIASFFGSGAIFGIPFQAFVFLLVFIITWFISRYTVFGKSAYAVGGNAESARLSGINVLGIRMAVMSMIGIFTVLSAIMVSSQIQAGNPTVGVTWEFTVITACVIGGVSLMGGTGTIIGSIVGALMIGLINNGLILFGLDYSQQLIARGGIIVLAVALSQRGPRR